MCETPKQGSMMSLIPVKNKTVTIIDPYAQNMLIVKYCQKPSLLETLVIIHEVSLRAGLQHEDGLEELLPCV